MKKVLCLTTLLLISCLIFSQAKYKLSSPNGEIGLTIEQNEKGFFNYSFSGNKQLLIHPSTIGYELADGTIVPSKSWTIDKTKRKKRRSTWHPIWGKRKVVKDRYNALTLTLKNQKEAALSQLILEFRVYDDGAAFRFVVPQKMNQKVNVKRELTSFFFAGDYIAWFYNFENANIGPLSLSQAKGVFHPVMTIKADQHHYLALHEADLAYGNPLLLKTEKGSTQFTVASKPEALVGGFHSAWRVIFYGKTPGTMVDSHLIELLNPDPLPDYDFSWVKPGIALWDWRINGAKVDNFTYSMSYPSWIRMVDFASQQGFRYLVLDANWYGPEFKKESDPTKGDKAKSVRQLIAYAKTKGVGIWLYLNDIGGRKYPLKATLKQYGNWGAAGVKYGFMRGNFKEKNERTRLITRLCADNKLLINFHDGPIHPYGQMRTWPNAITREYCHAQLDAHRVFQPTTMVTTVFVNMLAGPLDMNNGMFDLRQGHTTRTDESHPVPSTLASETARTLIVFSGATILPDIPEFYHKYPSLLRFITAQKMPWLESKTLAGEIGKYIVMMRETETAYLIGIANNEKAKTLHIPLDFLPKGIFNSELSIDGKTAHYLTNREALDVLTPKLNRSSILKVKLAPGGGACLVIKKK